MLEQVLTDPEKIGIIGLLAIAVAAFMREWVYTAAAYNRMKQERDEFKDMVIRSVDTTDRALRTAEKAVKTRGEK
jgi:hypothetical protein